MKLEDTIDRWLLGLIAVCGIVLSVIGSLLIAKGLFDMALNVVPLNDITNSFLQITTAQPTEPHIQSQPVESDEMIIQPYALPIIAMSAVLAVLLIRSTYFRATPKVIVGAGVGVCVICLKILQLANYDDVTIKGVAVVVAFVLMFKMMNADTTSHE